MSRLIFILSLCLVTAAPAAEAPNDEDVVQIPFGQIRKLLKTNEIFYGNARDARDEVLRLQKEIQWLKAKLACV